MLVVDSRRSRLYVFANASGRPKLVADYYVTLGKNGIDKAREGDQKTPVGVYHVTANLPRNKLTDFYGAGAFPINYPNEWDSASGPQRPRHLAARRAVRRLQPPAARERRLHRALQPRPRVGRPPRAGRPDAGDHRRRDRVERRRRRRGRARHASPPPSSSGAPTGRAATPSATSRTTRSASRAPGQNLAAWAAHKRKVNGGKQLDQGRPARVAMFRYPRERDFVVVTFDQDYRRAGCRT